MSVIVVTGAAGFIGSSVCHQLLDQDYQIIAIDNMNDYYDTRLKEWRLQKLKEHKKSKKNFTFYRCDIEDLESLTNICQKYKIDAIINEAARAGVRYSIENPHIYLTTNANGNLNLLEICKKHNINKYILASTSSLYAGQPMPFQECLPVNEPISPYAASKKAAEAMAYSYHHLFDLDVTILRYFTVYGPAGRPDMAPLRFIKWTLEGTPLTIYGDGSQTRDFTYVEDIARGTIKALKPMGFEVINLGNNHPDKISKLIELIEEKTGKKSIRQHKPFHKADMIATWANVEKANQLLGWKPEVSLEEGVERSVRWAKESWDWVRKVSV
ncbi:SDR family NAD(P)-dependent oxidoreductase [Heliorestis convoluta]|uniref:NAD-dependent epimerase/dehydratase n=1 Tax=Heliorestis convoluta TaxID=356322 RepID=A0A5Q2MXF5_9FIRM|nr:SDR family NAD(P)-dependent oxidoreductase [Heliorestis convoluta]QGG47197.1 NAD-dependent epimerase/dehydratase [Heliorestis convoluta]